MEIAFYVAAAVAIASTLCMLFSRVPVHGLLYLIISLLAVAMIFFAMGASFSGALEIIVYAGAIMVLFVFVVMMLNLGDSVVATERKWMQPKTWALPVLLSSVLLGQLLMFLRDTPEHVMGLTVSVKQVGIALYGPYILAVELGSLILLAALVVAFHLGRRDPNEEKNA